MARTRLGRPYVVLVPALVLLAGAALRLASFDQSFFGDELYAYREVVGKGSLGDVFAAMRHNGEVTPPLYFVVGWLTVKLGAPFTALRVPSLIAGLLTIPTVYLLGARAVSRRAGLVAATLVALSPFAIFYSTEARPYSLLALASALSTLALLTAIDTRRAGAWIGFSLAAAAAVYLHYTAIFVALAQGAWALWFHRDRWRELAASYALPALAFVPWLGELASNASNLGDAPGVLFFSPLTAREALDAAAHWAVGAPFVALDRLPGTAALVLMLVGVVAAAVGVVPRLLAGRGSRRPQTLLVWLLAMAAPAGIVAYSLVGRSILASRNFYSSLPALAVAIGSLLTAPRRPSVAVAASVLVCAGLAVGALTTLESDTRRPANAEAAAFIERHGRPGDPILQRFYSDAGRQSPLRALSVHLDRPHPLFSAAVPGAARAALTRARARRLFVANQCYFGRCVPTRQLFGEAWPLLRRGFDLVTVRRYPGFEALTVSVYQSRD